MNSLAYLSTLFSCLFRLVAYVFLRVVPSRLGKLLLPGFYLGYLASSWFWRPSCQSNATVAKGKHSTTPASTSGVAPRDALRAVLLSTPTSSRRVQLTNLIINTLLMIASIDLAITPLVDSASDVTFTRVGAVYPDSAKIVVRYPPFNSSDDTNLLLMWREAKPTEPINTWRDGPIITLKEESDWVDTVKLENLWPSTSYEYILSTPNRTALPYPAHPIRFHTFPDPRLPNGNHFRFMVSSCIMPNFPYMGPFNRRTITGFDLLSDYIFPTPSYAESNHAHLNTSEQVQLSSSSSRSTLSEPGETAVPSSEAAETLTVTQVTRPPPAEFLMFLGDFIYADVPLYIGDDKEAYRRLYRRNYQSHSFRKIYERLSIFHTYDDHEFVNNYGGNSNDTPPYPNASDAFKIYNADANYDSLNHGQHYYEFRHGDVAFFVMDTRRYRTDLVGTDFSTRTMLGDTQLAALYDWLSRVNGTSTFKFIVSSVPFTSLWGHDAVTDSWAGFPTEKANLLEAFHTVPNVIILSGDRHEFAAIEFNPRSAHLHTVHEFSTSPLNMFYVPFIRTLRMQSDDMVQRIRTKLIDTEAGPEIVTSTEEIPQERVLRYIPEGNAKWSSIELNTKDLKKPMFRLDTIIDGKTAYSFEMIGTPVNLQSSTAIGAFVASGVRDIFDKIGIKPSRWF